MLLNTKQIIEKAVDGDKDYLKHALLLFLNFISASDHFIFIMVSFVPLYLFIFFELLCIGFNIYMVLLCVSLLKVLAQMALRMRKSMV